MSADADMTSFEGEVQVETMVAGPATGPEEDEEEEDEMSRLFDSEYEEEEPLEDRPTPPARAPGSPLFLPHTALTPSSPRSSGASSAPASPSKGGANNEGRHTLLAPPSRRSHSADSRERHTPRTSSAPSAGPSIRRSERSSAARSTSVHSPLPSRHRYPPTVEVPLLPLRQVRNYSFPKGIAPPSETTRRELPGVRRKSIYVGPSESGSQYNYDDPLSSEAEGSSIQLLTPPPRRSSRSATRNAGSIPPNKRARRTRTGSSELSSDFGGYGAPDSDAEEDGEAESDSEEGDTSDDPLAMRRNTRSSRKGREGSRRVTRSHRRDENHHHHRDTASRRRQLARDSQSWDGDEEEYTARPRQPPKSGPMPGTKRKRARASDSGSDFVLGDDPLEEESSEDDIVLLERNNEEALTRHRGFCEKCSRGPADDLLEKVLKKKARAKPKKGKARKKDEDEYSEEETIRKLEGWVECKTCVVNSHWGCLGEAQRYEIKHRLRLQDGPPRQGELLRHSLYIHESTTFTCAKCKANPRCFVCHQDKIELDKEGDGRSQTTVMANGKKRDNGDKPKVNGDGGVEQQEAATPAGGDDVAMADGTANNASSPKLNGDASAKDAEHAKNEGAQDSTEKPSDNGLHEEEVEEEEPIDEDQPLKFRCLRCKQSAHYEHLKQPYPDAKKEMSPAALAEHYQSRSDGKPAWLCHQCREWIWAVDMVIAWRSLPADAKEEYTEAVPSYKSHLPREYLIKWANRGFRHVTWVTHLWLLANSPQKLRNFLEKGPLLDLITDETLATRGDDLATPTIANVLEEDDRVQGVKGHTHHHEEDEWKWGGPPPDVDAENSVPKEWSTTDRILDVMLRPPPSKPKITLKVKGKNKRVTRVLSDSGSERSPTPAKTTEYPPLPDGLEPPNDQQVDIDDWEAQTGRTLSETDLDEVARMVTWAYPGKLLIEQIKWDDLQHDQSAWDTPPPVSSDLYPAFKRALERFLQARKVRILVLSKNEAANRDAMAAQVDKPPDGQHESVKGGIEGFMWLVYNHFRRHSCILADDMGLGKTIQIASMLGYLVAYKVYPCLVIVPNSTITNWVREFEKWVPHVRVVAFYGEAASRKVISKYELYREGFQGKAEGLKAHVVLTTYDMITGGDFSVFRNIPRWEVVCVDEGQRLKNDNAIIFNRLRQLNSVHRILMTGTPLNNNIRELFNLLSFLDPANFTDLEALEERFDQDNLDEAKVKELHEIVRPYILRRIKADVLKLPPKIETIIPISLAPLQKQVYKLILEKNKDVLQSIVNNRKKNAGKKVKKVELVEATPLGGQVNNVNGDADAGADDIQLVERPPHASEELPNGNATENVDGAGASADGKAAPADRMDLDAPAGTETEAEKVNGVQHEAASVSNGDNDVAMDHASGETATAAGGTGE